MPGVEAAAQHALASTRSMGVALTPCSMPQTGKPNFEIGDDEMEIGMGLHGEPGMRRGDMASADEVVDELMAPILDEMAFRPGATRSRYWSTVLARPACWNSTSCTAALPRSSPRRA